MHWTDQFASLGRVDALVPAQTDPQSGQPALKMAQVSVEPAQMAWHGFAVSRNKPQLDGADYWAIAEAGDGVRMELAWRRAPADWQDWVRRAFGIAEGAELLSVHDRFSGRHSLAAFEGERLVFAVYLAPDPVLVARQWAASLLQDLPARRSDVLAGRPGADRPDTGAIVCACLSVGINSIVDAIQGGCESVDAIGVATGAGTNCGSCRAEIQSIIASQRLAAE
jgi:assimilatory nitrate reductase catalytic subunit